MLARTKLTVLLLLVAAAAPTIALAADAPLIPREQLFGNPQRANPQLSPDGTRLAWLAADDHGILQVWVQTIGKDDAHAVTADAKRPVRQYFWAWDDKTLLYLQDQGGDENYHVYAVDLASENVRDLTPWQGVRANVVATDPKYPTTILVEMNVRDRKYMDVWRLDLATGAATLDTQNPGDVDGWTTDDKLQVRAAHAILPDGSFEIRTRDSAKAKWKTIIKAGAGDEVNAWMVRKDGGLILTTTVGGDTSRLVALKGGKETIMFHDDRVDLGGALVNPLTNTIEAIEFEPGKPEYHVLDKAVQADLDGIAKLEPGFPRVVSRTRKDDVWLVLIDRDTGPAHFWRWDRKAKKGEMLFSTRPELEKYTFSPMEPIEYTTRDGLTVHGYLTLPPGGGKNLPLVLFVHGGPWARDDWGFDGLAQWLANRGYAVLQVNYRSSEGYGKKFLHAGDKQWGKTMQNDLTDAVGWAVKQGIADPKRVAIMGGSYGGYASLAGAAFTPDLYRCAVDIVGPSNLFTLLKSIPPYWEAGRAVFYQRMGDPEKDKEILTAASPLFSADKIKIPMLIGQGKNDPRVNIAESEQIVAAIDKNHGSVIYVVYTDEGHGFARPENNLDFFGRTENFLAQNLGGRAEPTKGDRYPGSTAVVRVIGGKKK